MADEAKTVLEIVTERETFRLTIPSSYKVTFGKVQPGANRYDDGGNALRVYESETKQRAIFLNVISFRDLSLPLERLVVAVEEEETFVADGTGNQKKAAKQKREATFQPVK